MITSRHPVANPTIPPQAAAAKLRGLPGLRVPGSRRPDPNVSFYRLFGPPERNFVRASNLVGMGFSLGMTYRRRQRHRASQDSAEKESAECAESFHLVCTCTKKDLDYKTILAHFVSPRASEFITWAAAAESGAST